MTTISVPTDEDRQVLSGLCDGVPDLEIVVWDGTGARPDGADRIEFFVGRYNATPPPAATLAALPALRVIHLFSAGVEPWLPVVPDGVTLCNARGVHGPSTAELGVAGMLAVLRGLPAFLDRQRRHAWERPELTGLDGARVLVLGAGDIGRRMGGVSELLGAEVTYVARTARDGVQPLSAVAGLLPRHQVVVVALPLTSDTEKLVDAAFLAAMPDDAVLVNVARGGHVDTDALLAELTSRRLRAFLDVVDPEPLPADHPLWDAPNLVFTPHVGGGTTGWQRRGLALIAEQVRRFASGTELQNVVANGY